MRIVTARAGQLAFSHGHVRGAHELRSSLQMALTTDLGLGSALEKRSFIRQFGELVFVGGFLHQGMAVDAGNPAARMGTCFPVGLNAPLVAAKTHFILHLRRLSRVFAKRDQPADACAAAG